VVACNNYSTFYYSLSHLDQIYTLNFWAAKMGCEILYSKKASQNIETALHLYQYFHIGWCVQNKGLVPALQSCVFRAHPGAIACRC
jgi:hypothetical protein